MEQCTDAEQTAIMLPEIPQQQEIATCSGKEEKAGETLAEQGMANGIMQDHAVKDEDVMDAQSRAQGDMAHESGHDDTGQSPCEHDDTETCSCDHDNEETEGPMKEETLNPGPEQQTEAGQVSGPEAAGAQPEQQSAQGQGRMDPAAYAAAMQQAAWYQQMAAAQAAQQGGNPNMSWQQNTGQPYAGDTSHHLKHDEHKYGQLLSMAQKFVNGEADMQDMVQGAALLENTGSQFWRGLVVGGVAALLLSSDTVKSSLAGIFQKTGDKE